MAVTTDAEGTARVARHQRLRLQRVWVASTNYVLFWGFAFYLWGVGAIALSLWGMCMLIALVACCNACFVLLISTGYNRRFRDPSLTRVQLAVGTAFQLVIFLFSRTIFAQDLALLAFLLSMLFAAFRMGARKLAVQAIPSFMAFAAIMLWRHDFVGQTLRAAIPRAAIYALLLGWIIFFVGYVNRLRRSLSQRNRELRSAMARIEELAIRDELTGAFNRRYIHEALDKEMARSDRTGSTFSICMLDVDHFKRVNHTHGHQAGDDVLHEVVARVRQITRRLDQLGHYDSFDTIGRLGGEEFLMVLPATSLDGARTCAERIRRAIMDTPFKTHVGELSVTASFGVTEYNFTESAETLIRRADKALYRAKTSGRNRIEANYPGAH
ncbi:MAG TPA: GGDEF domain-containing protein [Gammaproteobacteria bacterium]|nr:GGDEF domain-containing protein [Gammaproteobacteria bacterium]